MPNVWSLSYLILFPLVRFSYKNSLTTMTTKVIFFSFIFIFKSKLFIKLYSTDWIYWHVLILLSFVFKTYNCDDSSLTRSENSFSLNTGIFANSKFSST